MASGLYKGPSLACHLLQLVSSEEKGGQAVLLAWESLEGACAPVLRWEG